MKNPGYRNLKKGVLFLEKYIIDIIDIYNTQISNIYIYIHTWIHTCVCVCVCVCA